MNDHAGFLAAVLERPDDDLPRLVYADWLEERGQPERAEFIRVQCELAKPFPGCHCRECRPAERHGPLPCRQPLRARERELFAPSCFGETVNWGRRTHYDLPSTPGTSQRDDVRLTYRRGFVEAVTCTCADWLAHGPAVVRAQPVREVRLSDRRPRLQYDGWCWSIGMDEAREAVLPTSSLPPSLMRQLTGRNARAIVTRGELLGVREYDTDALALADLSRACLAWARAEARSRQSAAEPPLRDTGTLRHSIRFEPRR